MEEVENKDEIEETGMEKEKKWGLTGSALKIMAVALMVIDHIGAALLEMDPALVSSWWLDYVFRLIGRISFPIFCFLLTEGFLHTHNIKKYLLNLGAFSLISEIPFDLAFFGQPFHWHNQNIFFTLTIGLAVIWAVKYFKGKRFLQLSAILAGCALAVCLRTDYDAFGILLIAAFYLFRESIVKRNVAAGILLAWETAGFFMAGALALIPISLYRGERGRLRLKYFFYGFYPVHLLILYGVRTVFLGA